jgi:hypothetical protein
MIEHAFPARTLLVRGAAVALSLAALSACSDSTGVDRSMSSQLAFTAGGTASTAPQALVPITKDGHTLDLSAATVVVTRASLTKTSTDLCGADDDDEDDDDHGRGHSGNCGEVKIGPALVDLPLDGKLVTIPGNTIPPGTYRNIDVRVSLVRLEGTFDGKPFDVTIPVHAKAQADFETPLVVAADSAVAVTVNLPVDTWLVRSDGTLIDPTKLTSTPSLMALVSLKIASSIRAFEDRDHDGRDDHRHRD